MPETEPVPQGGGRDGSASRSRSRPSRWVVALDTFGPRRLNAIYLWLVFLVLFAILNPGTYLSSTTMTVVFSSGVVTCLLALAFLLPLTAGAYDLSIGAMMTFSLTLCVKLFNDTGIPLVPVAIIAIVACGLVGAVSGFIIVRLNVNSFIATLGTSQVLLAAVLLISDNSQLVGDFPKSWSDLGTDTVAGIPLPLFYLVALAAVIWYVLEFTRVGRYLYATGGNAEAARLAGVHDGRMVWGSMIASGMIAGFAGIVYAMQIGTATSTVGAGLLFPAVAAVFLGAAQFSQRPNVWGTLIAYFALAFGVQGLLLTLGGDGVWAKPLFEGVALIIAVAVASRPIRRRLRTRDEATDSQVGPADPPPSEPIAERAR